ncbi:MAG: TonB-dependent receptor, partial [Bacteroidota bacterium]
TNPAGGGYIVLGYNAVSTRLPQLLEAGELSSETDEADVNDIITRFDDGLEAESSVNFNFGVDYTPKEGMRISINLFRNNVNNLIDTQILPTPTAGGANIFSYQNINRIYKQGIELDTKWDVTQNISLSGGYQLLYAKDREAEDFFDSSNGVIVRDPETLESVRVETEYFGLFNRSRHMANFKIFYEIPAWKTNANIRGVYRSKYGLFDTNGNNYLDGLDEFVNGYTIWDLAINKTINKNLAAGFGIDNLLDFTDPVNISNIPGRLFYGKLNVNF